MLNTKIKASQISNLTDARYFAAWMIDWMGFCLDEKADHRVTPELLHAIRDWVEGPVIVGEFGEQEPEYVREAVNFLKLDAVQIDDFYDKERLEQLEGISVIREILVDKNTSKDLLQTCENLAPYIQHFLLDCRTNNINWQTIKNSEPDLKILQQICSNYPIILSMDIKGDEVHEVMDTLKPEGLNVFGGAEEKVGFKSYDELDELFEELED